MKVSEKQLTIINFVIIIVYEVLLFTDHQWLLLVRMGLGFLILTYFLGRSVRLVLKRWIDLPSSFAMSGCILDITISIVMNEIISYALISTFNFFAVTYITMILLVNVGLNCLDMLLPSKKFAEPDTKGFNVTTFTYLLIIMVSSVLMVAYFRNETPLPTINGWDVNCFLAHTNWIIENHGYPWILISPYPEGSLIPYPALFFYIISSYSLFVNVSSLEVFWYGVYALVLGYMSTIFMVALKLSKNHILSLCSAFTAFFLSCGLAEVVRSPLFFTPEMVAHLLFLLMVILFLCYEGNSKFKSLIMLIMAVNLAMLYYPAIVITFPLLLYFVVGRRPMRLVKSGKSLFYLTSLLLPVLIVHTSVIPVIRGEFWSLEAFDTSLKVNVIQLVYPIYFWVVFALSVLFLICSQRSMFDKKWVYWDLLLIIGIWAIIYFFPMWISYRIELYIRSFLAIFISGMISFSDKFFNSLKKTNLACGFGSRFKLAVNPGHIVSVLTLFFLCSTLCTSFTNYAGSFQSYTSRDECDAAFWIRDNTPLDSYILTDPSSGYVIRGLALRNSSTFFVLPDGRMPSDASTILPNARSLIHSFFNSESLDQAKSILGNFKYRHVFVVITSRTVVWARCSVESIFTHPFENQDLSIFDKFLDPQSFRLLHSSPSVRIYFYRTPKP